MTIAKRANPILIAVVWAMAHLRQMSFPRALARSLTMILPFALIGSITRAIQVTIFFNNGFFNNIFYLDDWVPKWVMNLGGAIFMILSAITLGLIGLVAAYAMARNTARLFQRDDLLAGITAVATMLLSAYQFQRLGRQLTLTFNYPMLGYNTILYGLLIGYLVGRIFKRWGPAYQPLTRAEHTRHIRQRTYAAGLPLTISLIIGMVICLVINWFDLADWAVEAQTRLQTMGNQPHHLSIMILMTLLSVLLDWMGFSWPYSINNLGDSAASAANLTYALIHGSTWHIPYQYLWSSLYPCYAKFGGTGLVLPLLVALLVASRRKDDVKLCWWTIGPAMFNSTHAVLIGLPLMLNPLYLLPYVLLPLVNILIAMATIALHWVPAPTFPIPAGTPGPLGSFLATNGAWQALLLSIALFVIDVLAYIPFVKIASSVSERIRLMQGEADQHEG